MRCIKCISWRIMKNPKSILTLVFLFAGVLFQAYASPTGTENVVRLKDKVAPVTEAASENGKAIASLFEKEGAKAASTDINADGAWTCY